MKVELILGDCLEVLRTLPDNSIDSVVTDPPYGLSFMNKQWDYDVPTVDVWRECLRVLKPGGHLLSFAGSRTYHRIAVRIEDAGFEIRDQIMWVYGSGFPKSHNISKKLGEGYEGIGTALKPAHEPIVMARKPLSEKSIVENVLKHGTGGINIDGSRIGTDDIKTNGWGDKGFVAGENYEGNTHQGRWPANIIFDEEAGKLLDEQAPLTGSAFKAKRKKDVEGGSGASLMRAHKEGEDNGYFDERGGASRFFYCPKTSKTDRNEGLNEFEKKTSAWMSPDSRMSKENYDRTSPGMERFKPEPRANNHPTVKPTDLMRYLINLVTPPNGTILDPFMGSGSTGKAAVRCGVNFIGIEKEQEYIDIARARIEHEKNKPVQQTLFNGKS